MSTKNTIALSENIFTTTSGLTGAQIYTLTGRVKAQSVSKTKHVKHISAHNIDALI